MVKMKRKIIDLKIKLLFWVYVNVLPNRKWKFAVKIKVNENERYLLHCDKHKLISNTEVFIWVMGIRIKIIANEITTLTRKYT